MKHLLVPCYQLLSKSQGQASLPEACPVCYHEPVKPDDCRPNKALRTTVKVFLRKKVVERENAEKKRIATEKAAAAPATPLAEETLALGPTKTPDVNPDTPASVPAPTEAKSEYGDNSQKPPNPETFKEEIERAIPTEAQKDIPQMSIEVRVPSYLL